MSFPPPPAFDAERVRLAMKEQGVTQTAIRDIIGVTSQSAVSNILKGLRRVTADEGAKIYRFLRLNENLGPTAQHVPIIGYASAGSWREAVQLPIGTMSVPPKQAGPRSFAIEVDGDSLNMIVAPGGYLVIDPDQRELRPGKFYLIQNGNHETTVKLYERSPARFEPASTNCEHEPIPVADVDRVIGRVCWKADPL